MSRIAALAALMLAACQQAAPVDETNADAANIAAAGEPGPPGNTATPPEPARIPANFHGLWAEDDAACGELTHHSRLTVTGNSVRYPAFVLAVDSVTQPAPLALAVKGYSKQTKAPTEAHFSIDATGNILTDQAGGGAVRVRCV